MFCAELYRIKHVVRVRPDVLIESSLVKMEEYGASKISSLKTLLPVSYVLRFCMAMQLRRCILARTRAAVRAFPSLQFSLRRNNWPRPCARYAGDTYRNGVPFDCALAHATFIPHQPTDKRVSFLSSFFLSTSSMRGYCYSLARVACSASPTSGLPAAKFSSASTRGVGEEESAKKAKVAEEGGKRRPSRSRSREYASLWYPVLKEGIDR